MGIMPNGSNIESVFIFSRILRFHLVDLLLQLGFHLCIIKLCLFDLLRVCYVTGRYHRRNIVCQYHGTG